LGGNAPVLKDRSGPLKRKAFWTGERELEEMVRRRVRKGAKAR
jgi:hypothetical protein